MCALAAGGAWAAPAQAISYTQTTLPFSGLTFPYGVAVDRIGDVLVTVTDNNRGLELLAGGTEKQLPFRGLKSPEGIAVDGSGDVFVADTGNARVLELSVDRTQTTLPFTGLVDPGSVAVDRSGGPTGS